MKFASLFTGLGGADIGAMQAGLTPIWGVEIDSIIADHASRNVFLDGIHDVWSLDVKTVPFCGIANRPDWLHASPPCVNASRAKNGKETDMDSYLAEGICKAIAVLKPEYFSLENVAGYADYESFKLILKRLVDDDYDFTFKVLDCAQYGIPQSRKRLFLVASKNNWSYRLDSIPLAPVVNWKEAIADLIPTLKPTTLTEWQKEAIRHKEEIDSWISTFVIQRSGARKKDGIPNNTIRLAHEPMFTIKAMSGNIRTSVNQVTIVIDGQPYQADERCLARWQTIPDWYQFNDDHRLNVKMIGNAVPPLMMQKIIESVIN